MPSKRFKTINCKTPQLKLFRFFQTISDKNCGKNYYLNNFLFLFLPPFNNVEKQWQKKMLQALLWGSPHWKTMSKTCFKLCYGVHNTVYGGDGGFLKNFFKVPIIFCHWLSKIFFKRQGAMHAVSNNSYLP